MDGGRIQSALLSEALGCFFPAVDSIEHQMGLGLPYRTASGIVPMNEAAAMYAVVYFLSSLVRYQPAYMDAISENSDAWLVESFVKSAPSQLLRYMVSATLGYSLIIESA